MIQHQNEDRSDHCDQQTIQIDTGNTRGPEEIEEPSSNDCSNDSQRDIEDNTLPRFIDKLAADEAGDQA